MLKRQIGTLFLATCLILTTVPAALGAQNTVTVSPSGTAAQTAINNAINSVASGATSNNPGYVLLTAGTYKISAPIVLKSNVVLKGAGDNTIIYATGSVCNSESAPAYVFGSGVSNVEVCNLQFKSSASSPSDGGHGDYRNCIQFRSVTNSKVHDILFTRYLYSDGVRISKSSGINVFNCRMYSVGHDGVSFLSGTKNSRMYNCDVEVQTNTGVRIDNCANIEVDHNTFSGSAGSGWCCVELENSLTNANVHHNIMHDFKGSSSSAGVGNVGASGSISVHDNVMWAVSPYIQVGSGSNVLGPSDQSVKNWVAKGYGYGSIGNTASSTKVTSSTSATSSTNVTSSTSATSSTSTAQQSPVAGFVSSVTSGKTPLKVQFTDKSTNNPTSWKWSFGDGTYSTEKNPVHTYTKLGKYTVSLTAKNAKGSNTKSTYRYIEVSAK